MLSSLSEKDKTDIYYKGKIMIMVIQKNCTLFSMFVALCTCVLIKQPSDVQINGMSFLVLQKDEIGMIGK